MEILAKVSSTSLDVIYEKEAAEHKNKLSDVSNSLDSVLSSLSKTINDNFHLLYDNVRELRSRIINKMQLKLVPKN